MDKIYIDQETGKLVNIYAPFKGRSRIDTPEIRAEVGVVELDADAPPSEYEANPDFYTVREDWEAVARPYVIYERKPQADIDALMLAKAKQKRTEAVAEIVVTTQAGNSFDGYEDAQNRMGRSIGILSDTDVMPWVLADNSVVQVTKAELQEALRLAGLRQAELWVQPYL